MQVKVTAAMSLAGVRDAIKTRDDLPAHARRDMLSALQAVAKVAGRPLDTISTDVPALRGLLEERLPAAHGISPARWRNVRCLLAKSLHEGGATAPPKRSPLAPEWEDLLHDLPEKPHRIALIPFGRFCSQQGLAPGQVCQATFAEYADHLHKSRLLFRPREVYLAAARAWNSARRKAHDWPALRIEIENRRDWYVLPWSDFPPSLKVEVDRWISNALDPDPLDVGASKPLRRATAHGRERAIRAFASAIVLSGRVAESLRSMADLIELNAVREGLRWFMSRTSEKRSAYLKNFSLTLLAIARHVVYRNDPDRGKAHIAELQRLCKAVDPGRRGMTEKNRDLLRSFESDQVFEALLALPERIWHRHAGKLVLKTSELVELQVALAVELLIHAPVRLRNLVSIRIDNNLKTVGSRRARRVYLYFPPGEVKNGVETEFELSGATITLLDRYLAVVRPQLIRDPSPFLFPSPRGGHKIAYILSNQIADLTATELGVRMTAHQFRHVAGHAYLSAVPGGHEVVRRLLGHKNIHTTVEFYAGMEIRAAYKHYDSIISRKRTAYAPRRSRPPAKGEAADA